VNVKVTDVDLARKRIALSIKQTLALPAKTQKSSFNKPNKPQQQKPAAAPTMNDALAALKQKFGK
jgi:uncharacterized protein